MAKVSYNIVDHNGKKCGVLFLSTNGPQTESTSLFENAFPTIERENTPGFVPIETVEKSSFWQSDGVKFSLAGLFTGTVVMATSWWYDTELGALAAVAAIGAGFGLHLLKIILHRPARPATEKSESETVIKVEHWDNAHVEIDYVEDNSITTNELQRVARAVVDNDLEWLGRSRMCKAAGLSQPKYGKIRDEFMRLNYVHNGAGNTTVLGLRGKSFLRQLAG